MQRGGCNNIELLIIPAFSSDLSFSLSLSPLQGCSCSLPFTGDIHKLFHDSPSLLSRLGQAGHCLWLGSQHPRDDCPCLYPPVDELVSDR